MFFRRLIYICDFCLWRSYLVCWMFRGWYRGYQEHSLHCQSDSVWRFGWILHISGSVLGGCYVSEVRSASPWLFSIYKFIFRLPFSRWTWCLGIIQRKIICFLTCEWVLGIAETQPRQKGIIEHLQTTFLLRAQIKAHDTSFAPHVTKTSPLRKVSVTSFSVHKAALVH